MLQKSLKVKRRVWLFYNLMLRREFRLSDKVYHFVEFHRRCFVPIESCKSYLEHDSKRGEITNAARFQNGNTTLHGHDTFQ